MDFFDSLGKEIVDVGRSAIQKTKDMADASRYSSLIGTEERKIAKHYCEIGKLYVEKHGEEDEEGFAELVAAIKEAQKKIEIYKEENIKLQGHVKCPNCGMELSSNVTFCAGCGTRIEKESAGGASPNMVYCSKCGAAIAANLKFCTSCGAPQ